ncbi:MAG: T9SS type A sorting domain-containing protein [Melioribacter sp.]|nr:T9SS type A sorting domain-containing protein [Melioribacter sp.]
MLKTVSGNHDLYLRFKGSGSDKLFNLQSLAFIDTTPPTSIQETGSNNIPDKFILEQNYPNPFNPSTVIGYQLSVGGYVQLKVYDILGREVAILVDEFKFPGVYSLTFDACKLSSGIYFYQLKAGSFISTKKMIFLK